MERTEGKSNRRKEKINGKWNIRKTEERRKLSEKKTEEQKKMRWMLKNMRPWDEGQHVKKKTGEKRGGRGCGRSRGISTSRHWAAYSLFDVCKPPRLLRGSEACWEPQRLIRSSDMCFISSSSGSALHRWIITVQLTALSEGRCSSL